MKGSNSTYFGNIKEAVSSLLAGLRLSFRHFLEATQSRKPVGIEDDSYFEQQTGIVTLQYPRESLPVPDNGRYRLHNEIEDCIVCDKCAKICPVDCIEIEPVRAVEEIGRTSDGTPKRLYAATFDIDMGKCCFCGLCTTVCPTECLTMTKAYDFSEYDSADHIYAFSEMSPLEILQKKQELEAYTKQKEAEKAKKSASGTGSTTARPGVAQPGVARPGVARPESASPKPQATGTTGDQKEEGKEAKPAPRPAFKPKVKPVVKKEGAQAAKDATAKPDAVPSKQEEEKTAGAPKPRFRPKIKGAAKPVEENFGEENKEQPQGRQAEAMPGEPGQETAEKASRQAKPVARPKPVMKPKIKPAASAANAESGEEKSASPKPARPLIKPKMDTNKESPKEVSAKETKPTPPVVKPTGLPKKPTEEEKSDSDKQEEQKVKPTYRPKPIIRKKKDE